jgi:hypothetical protein
VAEREIKLSGGEISILKALGFSGTQLNGKLLLSRIGEMETAELLDTLNGLISLGYVNSSKINVTNIHDVERSSFRINASYARDLRDSLRPGGRRQQERPRRTRR